MRVCKFDIKNQVRSEVSSDQVRLMMSQDLRQNASKIKDGDTKETAAR